MGKLTTSITGSHTYTCEYW